MKEWVEWLAKAAAIVLCGLSVVVMAGRSEFVLSAAETLMYVVVLCAGYGLGAGAGAAAGIFCALIRVTEGEGLIALPAFLLAGTLAGIFRHLGKRGSLVAFLCGMVLGSLNGGPEFLLSNLFGVCGGGLIFLMVPDPRMKRLDVGQLKAAGKSPEYERLAAVRLGSIGEVLELLAEYYQEVPEFRWEPGGGYSHSVTWYAGYLEEKLAAAVGMEETARLINSLLQEYQELEDITGSWENRLREVLREKKVYLDELKIMKNQRDRLMVDLTVRAMRSRCIPARELTAALSKELGREVKPDLDVSAVIGREPCHIRFREDTGFHMLYEVVREAREESDVSGDNFSCMRLPEGKAVLGLSDGMGTGEQAAKDSEAVMELMEKLLCAGYGEEAAARLINAILIQRGNKRPVTLDLTTVDLYTGNCCFTKLGAVTTFLRRDGHVETICAEALPAGVLTEAAPVTENRELTHGDMIVMVTDGVLDALASNDKEEVMKILLSGIRSDNPKEIARQILDCACKNGGRSVDDMTVLAAGFWRK